MKSPWVSRALYEAAESRLLRAEESLETVRAEVHTLLLREDYKLAYAAQCDRANRAETALDRLHLELLKHIETPKAVSHPAPLEGDEPLGIMAAERAQARADIDKLLKLDFEARGIHDPVLYEAAMNAIEEATDMNSPLA